MNGLQTGGAVPQRRIREKLDAYLSRRDYAAAGRHLAYWLEEARLLNDPRGELMMSNELIGHCRKTGDRDGAFRHIEAALALVDRLELGDAGTGGPGCLNAATAMNAFGDNDRALRLFERARTALEAAPLADPALLAGLYNNMGLACAALKRWDDAMDLYDRALARLSGVENGQPEAAVTCLNMANCIEAQVGMEAGEGRIFALMDRAAALLDTPGIPHDGHYAFVCEKCAPTFEYYGWFADARRFQEEAERIYAGA